MFRVPSFRPEIGAAILLLQGCSSAPSEARAVITDSASVEIVTVPENVALASWGLSAEPLVAIGTVDGEPQYQFHRVTSGLLFEDGGFAIANSGTAEVRFFTPLGEFLKSSGNRGGGPGEFRSIGLMFSPNADSIFVFDPMLTRFTVLSGEGSFIRNIALDGVGAENLIWSIGVFSDGSILIGSGATASAVGDGLVADTATYLRVSRTGELINSVGRFPFGERITFTTGPTRTVLPRPFGASGHAIVAADHVTVGYSNTYELQQFSKEGSIVRRIRVSKEPSPLSNADVEVFRRERPQAIYRDPRAYPEAKPVFARIVSGAREEIWVEAYPQAEDEERRWLIFDDGVPVAEALVPDRFRILDIGQRSVLGVWRDEFDVENIHIYSIVERL